MQKYPAYDMFDGYTPDYSGIYEQVGALEKQVQYFFNNPNMKEEYNTYGTTNPLQLAYLTAVTGKYTPQALRPVIGNIKEFKPVRFQQYVLDNLYEMIKEQDCLIQ